MLVMIGTDWLGSNKSNYHTIMTTTAPHGYMYDSDNMKYIIKTQLQMG
jgi:hypothetical protein